MKMKKEMPKDKLAVKIHYSKNTVRTKRKLKKTLKETLKSGLKSSIALIKQVMEKSLLKNSRLELCNSLINPIKVLRKSNNQNES